MSKPPEMTFTCPKCNRTSHNPHDAANGYCGACDKFFRLPWTPEELEKLAPKIDQAFVDRKDYSKDARPLSPMTVEECQDLFFRMINIAHQRALTQPECFLIGQILSCYQSAVIAEVMGKKGRYFVVSEADIVRIMEK